VKTQNPVNHSIYRALLCFDVVVCGEKGIRTPGTASCTPDFESGPFDHSGISPATKVVKRGYSGRVKPKKMGVKCEYSSTG
jgi:hypothetical protein